jgi:predicted nucleotidyltransferase component of viral defense system
MQDSLAQLVQRYKPNNTAQAIQAIREIIQEIVLLGLWRSKFFEHAAFYGGTALRIFYQLNRFSEDLDFSLLTADADFSLDRYNQAIKLELESFGFKVEVETKSKNIDSKIESAFIKANTKQELINIGFGNLAISGISKDTKVKIKLEVDTDPPPLFQTEVRILNNPLPVSVRCYKPSYLFAGKMHALLYRLWGNRVKGRDWYDFVWFVTKQIPLNLPHLRERMLQSEHLANQQILTNVEFHRLLRDKIMQCDFTLAKQDIMPFIADHSILDCWDQEYFLAAANGIIIEN